MELTEKIFWEKFWNNISLPQKVDYSFKNDRIIAETIKKHIPSANKDKTVIEIGCAPGKWLVMFNKELGYKIAGLEYSEPAFIKTLENFEINEIGKEDTEIELVDFLNANLKKTYDVVISLGFIEHFDDIENIFTKHFELLNNSGYLILGVPNFRGLNYFIQKLIDKYIDQKIIPNHNLKVMNPKTLDSFAKKLNLKKVFSAHIGGFEPGLFNASVIKPRFLRYSVSKIIELLLKIFGRVNTCYTSGYIISIYKM